MNTPPGGFGAAGGVIEDLGGRAAPTSGDFTAKLNNGSTETELPLSTPTGHYFSWSIMVPDSVTLDLPPSRPTWESVDVDLSGALYQGLTDTTVTLCWYSEITGSDIDTIVLNGTTTLIGPPDETPPTPNPMTWSVLPTALDPITVTMTASTATDPSLVEYYFNNTTVADESHDSGWQGSPIYKDVGLMPETSYIYTVRARDRSPADNETENAELPLRRAPEEP